MRVSGYFWGSLTSNRALWLAAPATAVEIPAITLISASQTGNARRVAEALRDDLLAAKLNVNLVNAGDYKFKQIASEKLLVVVASTQGEGEPAEEAVALHKFLFSKKAPKLNGTAFAVFGLGDTSYEFFCQSGKDFDSKLAELGAERLLDRVDADVEYQTAAAEWRARIVDVLKARVPKETPAQAAVTAAAQSMIFTPARIPKRHRWQRAWRLIRKLPVAPLRKTCGILKSISVIPVCVTSRAMHLGSGTRTIRRWLKSWSNCCG